MYSVNTTSVLVTRYQYLNYNETLMCIMCIKKTILTVS